MTGPPNNPADADHHWHLDRRVPVALIFAILVQTAAALVWAGSAAARLEQLEQRLPAAHTLAERTARIEERLVHVQATVARIEERLERE